MASLFEKALDLLGKQVDSHADDWFDDLVDKLGEMVEESSNDELKQGGKAALQVLEDNQDKFVGLGRKSLLLFVAHVAAGKTDAATKEYLRAKASAREIIDSILGDAIEIERARKKIEELKKEAVEVGKLLLTGAKFLLPLLLTLI